MLQGISPEMFQGIFLTIQLGFPLEFYEGFFFRSLSIDSAGNIKDFSENETALGFPLEFVSRNLYRGTIMFHEIASEIPPGFLLSLLWDFFPGISLEVYSNIFKQ